MGEIEAIALVFFVALTRWYPWLSRPSLAVRSCTKYARRDRSVSLRMCGSLDRNRLHRERGGVLRNSRTMIVRIATIDRREVEATHEKLAVHLRHGPLQNLPLKNFFKSLHFPNAVRICRSALTDRQSRLPPSPNNVFVSWRRMLSRQLSQSKSSSLANELHPCSSGSRYGAHSSLMHEQEGSRMVVRSRPSDGDCSIY